MKAYDDLASSVKCSTTWRLGKVRSDDCAPLREERAAAKVDCVVLERLPINHQDVAFGGFHPLVDPEAAEALGLRNDGVEAVLNGFVEFGLPCLVEW